MRVGLFVIVLSTILSAVPASAGQTNTAAPASPSKYELKIASGKILYREAGTSTWKDSSTSSELVEIGSINGDHKVYLESKSIKNPKIVHSVAPNAPAKFHGIGSVVCLAVIDEQGRVEAPRIQATSGQELSDATLKALAGWSFKPAQLNGNAVAVLAVFRMEFHN